MDLESAIRIQFRLVDTIQRHFDGYSVIGSGDLGVVESLGRPRTTAMVESTLAEFFGADDAVLVRGAGTGAIRSALQAGLRPGASVLVHSAPIYPTTRVTLESMRVTLLKCDFNDLDETGEACRGVDAALVQHTRQSPRDRCRPGEVIATLRSSDPGLFILSDDNYAVMRVPKIGFESGATASAFSLFKLLGPEGIGCVVGKSELIRRIREQTYSGGSQVQGPEAMDALRSLVYAPVALAIQGRVVREVVERLCAGEIPEVKAAHAANAQSSVALVEFRDPIAPRVLEHAWRFGAAPHPVGAESRYEVAALFYRVSGTYLEDDPSLQSYMIRVNPMRAGSDTVLRVLRQTLDYVRNSG
ncbi:MAG: aminotransferase [Firmicutes bacterium]|nr:aminotransferase [Bacillota bacterium]